MENTVHCGYAAIIGKPNAGKSTLLNAILGQKLSITNPKPQTTRKRILGILSEPDYQVIFLDTPGIIESEYLLQEKMMEQVKRSISDADVVLYIIDPTQSGEVKLALSGGLQADYPKLNHCPVILLINKIDLINEDKLKEIHSAAVNTGMYKTVLPLSATEKVNVGGLLDELKALLPIHPKFYPDDYVSDEPERFFVTEMIREKLLELYRDEVPYSCEVSIEEFTERPDNKHYISALIYVERDTQKGIIIGNRGSMIKELGALARKEIEAFLEHPVYLELRVKVKENWRRNSRALREFGYEHSDED